MERCAVEEKGRNGFYQQTAVSSAAAPSMEDTQRGFPQKAINEVLLWGPVEDCLQREMEYFPYGEPQENVTTSCSLYGV